ncbi:7tm Chemosensory receptor [Popillia japonica]|uniref:7tm Chemosensory receptor n=1 Tax=Popillia japonica TaxID=7064 RepID=A0AAW1NGK4_POPJA
MFRNLNTLFTRNFLRKHQIKVLHQLNDVEVLDELVQTYQYLTGALRRINSSVSSQILFLMGFYFSSLTLQVLSIVQHIIHFKSIIYIIWGICAVLIKEVVKLWILLTIADNCQQEEDKIKKILYKIVDYNKGLQLRTKINGFATQLFHDKIELSAAGFFRLDLTVLVSILSAVVTYCAILYQSDPNINSMQQIYGFEQTP